MTRDAQEWRRVMDLVDRIAAILDNETGGIAGAAVGVLWAMTIASVAEQTGETRHAAAARLAEHLEYLCASREARH